MEDFSQFVNMFIGFAALLLTGLIALFGVVKYLLSIIRKNYDNNIAAHDKLFEKFDGLDELTRDRTSDLSSRITRLETIDEVNQRTLNTPNESDN